MERGPEARPAGGEAGWLLLQLYYSGRPRRRGPPPGLRLSRIEPDPVDRARLLLEPIRHDAEPLAAAAWWPDFKEAVEDDPDDRPAALAYFRALARDGTGIDEAIGACRAGRAPSRRPAPAGTASCSRLDRTGDLDGLAKVLAELFRHGSPPTASSPAIAAVWRWNGATTPAASRI